MEAVPQPLFPSWLLYKISHYTMGYTLLLCWREWRKRSRNRLCNVQKAIRYRESRLCTTGSLVKVPVLSSKHFASGLLMPLSDKTLPIWSVRFLTLLWVSKETMATRNLWDDNSFIMWPWSTRYHYDGILLTEACLGLCSHNIERVGWLYSHFG